MKIARWMGQKWDGIRSNLCFDNWPVILLLRLFDRRTPLVIFRKGALTAVVDYEANDHCGVRHCLSSGMYARYLRHLPRDQALNVIDLGGNTGGFLLCVVDAGLRIRRALTVEMNPRVFSRLQFHLACNGLSSVAQAVNAAVFSREDMLEIEDCKGDPGQSIYAPAPEGRAISVPAVTLDALLSPRFGWRGDEAIDLLKIDVEGAEFEILLSDTCTALARCRHLLIEIHQGRPLPPAHLVATLEHKGFRNLTDAGAEEKDVFYFQNTRAPLAGGVARHVVSAAT